MSSKAEDKELPQKAETTRRDFLTLTTQSAAVVGAACAAWPLVDSFNPSKDVLASASIEIDLSGIEPGRTSIFKWRGKPIFVKHRMDAEIKEARAIALEDLPDPEADEQRVKEGNEKWLVLIGICTHLGCVPISGKGDYKGWFCPCHGSHYDLSGRIRKGPAPTNMEVPGYVFTGKDKIKIG